MIRIFLGNVGSGKTISVIKELVDKQHNNLNTFSNIITKSRGKFALPKNHMIDKGMLIKSELVRTMKDGTPVFKQTFNKDFWVNAKAKYGSFNVVIDEAHAIMNARSSMSKTNKVISDFLALIRKVCNNPNSNATLTLISQLDNRIDVIAREMATEVRYHICVYDVVCKCGLTWAEHSELSPFMRKDCCPSCESYDLVKENHKLFIHFFNNIGQYQNWKYHGMKSMIRTKIFYDVNKYFPFYDTFQLDDLITDD